MMSATKEFFTYNTLLFLNNITFTIGQAQTSLLNHCLGTQRRPHPLPRAPVSFTDNNPFHIKHCLFDIDIIIYSTPKHKQRDVIASVSYTTRLKI